MYVEERTCALSSDLSPPTSLAATTRAGQANFDFLVAPFATEYVASTIQNVSVADLSRLYRSRTREIVP